MTVNRQGCRWPTAAGRPSPRSSTGSCDNWDQPDKRESGRPAADAGTSPTGGSSAGSRWTGPSGWPGEHPAGQPTRPEWGAERDRVYEQVMKKNENIRPLSFTQHYEHGVMDSALLLMPIEGFIDAAGPMWLSTLRSDGPRASVRQPGLPVQPGRLAGRAARQRGHLLAVHLLVRRGARPGRAAGREMPCWRSRRCRPTAITLGFSPRRWATAGKQLGNFPQAFTTSLTPR